MTRLILGALVLAQVAQAQSVAKPALATHTAMHETETGSWRAGDAIVWVRVAPTGAISVYASHGYRSAFAHAIIIAPEDADKWADIGEHMLAGQTQGPGAIMLADSDLALEPSRAGDSTVLAVRLGGVRPDGITFLMNGQSLREVAPILRATAKTSRAAQTASAAAPTPAPPPTPAPAAPAPAAPATPAPATPAAPHMAVVDSPPPAPVVVAAVSAPMAAPPEVATSDTPVPAPEAEVAPISPVVRPTPVVATVATVATVTPTAMPVVAQTQIVKVTKPKPTPSPVVSASLHRTSAGSISKSTAPEETSDATKLSQSTVTTLVKQWQSQLDLCYTEYGLKVNPALTGSIGVRLAIRPSGDVAAATFIRHNWSGTGGKEAESCMRTRVMAWMFPPASAPSAHEFTVAFAP